MLFPLSILLQKVFATGIVAVAIFIVSKTFA